MRPCIITVSPLPSSDKCLHGTRGQGPETLLLSSMPRRGPRGRSVLPRAGEQLARSRAAPVHCSALILGAGGGESTAWLCSCPRDRCQPAPAGTKLLSPSLACAGICGFGFCSGKQNVDAPSRSAQRVSGTWDREQCWQKASFLLAQDAAAKTGGHEAVVLLRFAPRVAVLLCPGDDFPPAPGRWHLQVERKEASNINLSSAWLQ